MFDRLIELVNLVSREKVRRIEIIGEKYNYNSIIQRLYKGIHDGDFKTDEEAAAALYDSEVSHEGYRQLKYKLEKRLINTLFHIDISNPRFNDAQTAYYTCYRNLATTAILAGRAARTSACSVAERTIRIALQYEFTNVAYELAKILTSYYSSHYNENKKYTYYSKIAQEQFEIFKAEHLAEHYYHELRSLHVGKAAHKNTHLKLAKTYAEELQEKAKEIKSYRFSLNTFQVSCIAHEIANNYEAILTTCDEAIQFFKSKKGGEHNFRVAIFTFGYKQILYYTTLKKYDLAEQAAIDSLKYVIEGSRNWFLAMQYYLILCLNSKQYQKAYKILIEAKNNKGFKNLHSERKELWTVYEAYVHYFIKHNKIEVEAEVKTKQFKYYRFLNSVPNYSKDKRGINVSILIIHILFLLENGKYDQAIDRLEALNQYSYRVLKKGDTYRSNCFIKMLIALIRSQFNRTALIRKSEEFALKLAEKPHDFSRQASNVEIVPYEDLWECVLETVKTEFWYKRE